MRGQAVFGATKGGAALGWLARAWRRVGCYFGEHAAHTELRQRARRVCVRWAGELSHFCGPLTLPPFSIDSNLPPSSIVVAEP